jgi:hypothetical protein
MWAPGEPVQQNNAGGVRSAGGAVPHFAMVGGYPAAVDATGRRRASGAGGSCQDCSQAGRATIAKLPAIQAEVVSQTMPLIMTAMPTILRKSVDRICLQKHCTSEQRAALEKAMARMSGASAS